MIMECGSWSETKLGEIFSIVLCVMDACNDTFSIVLCVTDACNDTFSIVLCVVDTCSDKFSIVLCVNGHMQWHIQHGVGC